MCVYRCDVQGAAVADAVGSRCQSVRVSRTSTDRQLRRHVLSPEVPHARRHVQQSQKHDARRVAVSAAKAAAAAIREQLQLSCRSVTYLSLFNFYRTTLCIARTMLSQDVRLSVCLPVCLSVRLSHAGILSKRLNIMYHQTF